MKKLSLIILSLFVYSCSSDNDEPNTNQESIYGKWYHKEIVIDNTTFPYDDHETCGKDYIEFYDQNKIKSIDVWNCQEELDWVGTFEKSNNNLTLSNGSETRTVEIIELNSNTFSYQYYYDSDNDGTNEQYIEKFTRL